MLTATVTANSLPVHLKVPDTSRMGGTMPLENDAAVPAALDVAWKLPSDVLMTCEVGVRNSAGEVYRRALVRGVAQTLYLEERTAQLAFVPELEDSEHDGSGLDIIFRRTAKK
jgi:hypothetical protein